MKNLMQKLVKATLCLGVVSVSLIACESDAVDDRNIIDLDQIDQIFDLDSIVDDSIAPIDITGLEPVDDSIVDVEEEVER